MLRTMHMLHSFEAMSSQMHFVSVQQRLFICELRSTGDHSRRSYLDYDSESSLCERRELHDNYTKRLQNHNTVLIIHVGDVAAASF